MNRAVLLVTNGRDLPVALCAWFLPRCLTLQHDVYIVAGAIHPDTRTLLEKQNAAFIPRRHPALPINFEKMQAVDLLSCYDQVLYLDTDILIDGALDGLFNLPGGLVASIQPEGYPLSDMFRDTVILPEKTWPHFNSGVMLFNRARLPDPAWLSRTLEAMLPAVLAKRVPWIDDQGLFNLAAAKLELNFNHMPDIYNACPGVTGGPNVLLWHFRPPAVKPWANRSGGLLASWYTERTSIELSRHPAYDAWDTRLEAFKREVPVWIETP